MAQATLPKTFTDASAADGTDLQDNFVALRDSVNSIDHTQLVTDSVRTNHIQSDAVTTVKIAPQAVDATKLAPTIHNLQHIESTQTIAIGASYTFTFSGFNTAQFPMIMVYFKLSTETEYRPLGSYNGAGAAVDIRVQCRFNVSAWEVIVFNGTGVSTDFRVVGIGRRA